MLSPRYFELMRAALISRLLGFVGHFRLPAFAVGSLTFSLLLMIASLAGGCAKSAPEDSPETAGDAPDAAAFSGAGVDRAEAKAAEDADATPLTSPGDAGGGVRTENGAGSGDATALVPGVEEEKQAPWAVADEETVELYNEGVRHFRGDDVPQDFAMAAKVFREAADRGHAPAQHNLGVMYSHGQGVEQDYDQARSWLEKAAAQEFPEAQFKMASLYAIGLGVTRDFAKAAEWVRKAAEQGHVEAQYNLATLYISGQGVEENVEEAVKWYRRAAERGHPTAQSNLGVFYASGKAVERDLAEARKWFERAAGWGNPSAMFNLGRLYLEGEAVERDPVEAYKWLSLAADTGDPQAASEQLDLSKELTSKQIVEAIGRADQFKVQLRTNLMSGQRLEPPSIGEGRE